MSEMTAEENYPVTYGRNSIQDVIEEHRTDGWQHMDPTLKMFSFEYLNGYDHSAAAVKAGLPKESALKTLRNPLVQAFLQDVLEDRQIGTNITQDFVSTMWMRLLPKLMGEEEVPMVTAGGASIEAKKFFASESVGALREMSKSTKFYEDGSGQGGLNLSIAIDANMSPQEASAEYMKLVKGEVL